MQLSESMTIFHLGIMVHFKLKERAVFLSESKTIVSLDGDEALPLVAVAYSESTEPLMAVLQWHDERIHASFEELLPLPFSYNYTHSQHDATFNEGQADGR